MLSEHDFLGPEECKRTRDIIFGLKEHWVNRAENFFPFFTLGAASYLDSKLNEPSSYFEASSRYNPILKSYFPSLYETLIEKLTEIFQFPVVYEPSLALPGFHIFLANKFFEKPIASTHFDLQFKSLKWEYKTIDYEYPISFTCAISLPQSPAGLNYWDISDKDVVGMNSNEIEKLKMSKEKRFYPYSIGKLVLHRGLILHQIAPCQEVKPTDERITLQGHGLLCDGKMRLYW